MRLCTNGPPQQRSQHFPNMDASTESHEAGSDKKAPPPPKQEVHWHKALFWHEDQPCPLIGRVSMDLITVDVTDLDEAPGYLTLLGPNQGVDDLAAQAGTIGYEVLTGLGLRYARRYVAQ